MDLFAPLIPESKQHPQFAELLRSEIHAGARALITSAAGRMGDPNGSFVRHFQGSAFHSRLFEVSCFAYLEEAGFTIDRSFECPDFIVRHERGSMAIEAVTANPTSGQQTDLSLREMKALDPEELLEKVAVEAPSRLSRILMKKVRHKYHLLEHCKGLPLVLMVSPLFEPGAPFYSDDAFVHLLFGPPEGAEELVPSFFQRSEASTISAVLYCNQFTVSKYLRLAMERSVGSPLEIVREGVCYRPAGADHNARASFSHSVRKGAVEAETWRQGITVFENPFADTPFQRGLLPASCYFYVQDGYVQREVTEFHPVVSTTLIGV